jgi:hypothetical protein
MARSAMVPCWRRSVRGWGRLKGARVGNGAVARGHGQERPAHEKFHPSFLSTGRSRPEASARSHDEHHNAPVTSRISVHKFEVHNTLYRSPSRLAEPRRECPRVVCSLGPGKLRIRPLLLGRRLAGIPVARPSLIAAMLESGAVRPFATTAEVGTVGAAPAVLATERSTGLTLPSRETHPLPARALQRLACVANRARLKAATFRVRDALAIAAVLGRCAAPIPTLRRAGRRDQRCEQVVCRVAGRWRLMPLLFLAFAFAFPGFSFGVLGGSHS